MRTYLRLPAAGALFFVSAWLMMIFVGILKNDLGVRPFGYTSAMVATIALWLIVAPAIGAVARGRGRDAHS